MLTFGVLFTVLGLDVAYVREYHEVENKASLFKACFLPGIVFLAAFTFAAIFFGEQLSSYAFGEEKSSILMITVIATVFSFASRFLSLILRMKGDGVLFSLAQITPKFVQFVLLVVVALFEINKEFEILLLIQATSLFAAFLVLVWLTRHGWRQSLTEKINKSQLVSLLRFGFPLVFSGLSYWGLTAAGVLLLRYRSSFDELGIYSIVCGFAGVASVLQSVFTVIWSPMVFKWASKNTEVKHIDYIINPVMVIVCLIFCLIGCFSWLLGYVLPSHYSDIRYLLVAAIAPPLYYILSEVTGIGVAIARRTIFVFLASAVSFGLNVLLGFYLIPAYGAGGAIVANLISYFVFFLIRTETSALVWRNFKRAKIYLLVSIVSLISIYGVIYKNNSFVPIETVWVIAFVIFIFMFKGEVLNLRILLSGRIDILRQRSFDFEESKN